MQQWIRKIFVALVAILTFGTVVPSNQPIQIPGSQKNSQHEQSVEASGDLAREDIPDDHDGISIPSELEPRELFFAAMLSEAEKQGEQKFGFRIEDKIGEEYRQIILPELKNAVGTLTKDWDDGEFGNHVISSTPAGGYGEKIFHIYHSETGKDVFRYHVRRERPPLDGHYFAFHYHSDADSFTGHYTLGKIYWGKNTPPKWQS
ncbi:YpjP family protein [Bacillus marinisedimentorum]|uniref:YpjP family protein n=1 Tax=Bacillus marinisedimentorum TaxID=1821260 RepID=UPI0007DEC26B|nr:YpjP family protein [Bacillus marinisedimentorum]